MRVHEHVVTRSTLSFFEHLRYHGRAIVRIEYTKEEGIFFFFSELVPSFRCGLQNGL